MAKSDLIDDPAALERALAKLEKIKPRLDAATARVEAIERQREEAYLECRRYVGGTYRVIAARYGITEAAVMQKVNRAEAARDAAAAG